MTKSRDLTLWMDFLDKAHYDKENNRTVFDDDVPKEAIESYEKWKKQYH